MATENASDCILIMEDEELVSTIAMQMLEFIGYNSVLAVDGGEALELYQQRYESGSPFNGVIMDLNIPGGMGGEEAVQELLKIDSSANPDRGELIANEIVDRFEKQIPEHYQAREPRHSRLALPV